MNELFSRAYDPEINLLPHGGTVNYYGKILAEEAAGHYFNILMHQVEWRNDEAVIFGKKIYTRRKVAWYGDENFEYTYSNSTKKALIWLPALLEVKHLTEVKTGETFNSCLLNLYHDGSEGMAYHSDGERDLKHNGAIASLSLGAERKFSFKNKTTKERVDVMLGNGSLLVMKGETQKYWLHRLPPTRKVFAPRINLTFRTIVNVEKKDAAP